MVAGSASAKRDPPRAEFFGARRLGSIGVNVHAADDLEVDESCGDDRRLKLCLQQSARDSAFPEIDVPFGLFTHRLLDQDVADL
jgi:hypothetical protein